jgi:aspartyl-tRNA(Asn)/glutamyl-tRNA(Gln) amidotransferase subunit A
MNPTIEQAARRLRAREVSSVELAEESLRRIRNEQPKFNAFITITEELALAQARRADEELARGIDRGPLQGIPYALKDNFAVGGVRTTVGSKIFENLVTDHDSAVYERLTEAGAVLMGKAGLQELAYGITCNNPHFGAIRNPHDPERIPGGSSGGCGVAVATGSVFFAMGTDTGGSIRIPASFCGCVGLKPTSGRVSRYGVMPLDFSLDHMGPLTRTAGDAALVLEAIAGFDPRDDTSSRQPVPVYKTNPIESPAGMRIGVAENFYNERVAPQVSSAFVRALGEAESAGARLLQFRAPDPAEINVVSRIVLLAEASALMEPYLHRRPDFGADVLALLDQGRMLSATDYINAQRLRRVYQKEWAKVWKQVDVVFTPTSPITAPKIGQASVEIDGVEEDVRLAATRFVRAINVIGMPAVSVPLKTEGGLPIGLQIVGRPFGEAEVLGMGAIFGE